MPISFFKNSKDDFNIGYMEKILFAELSPFHQAMCRTFKTNRRDDWDYEYNDPNRQVYPQDIKFLRDEVRKYRVSKGVITPVLLREPKQVSRMLFQENKERKKFYRTLKRKGLYVNNEGFICKK